MKIELFHGRDNADDELEDWGYGGPEFRFKSVRWTYGHIYLLFDSLEDAETARALTGWKDGPFEYSLELEMLGDLVVTQHSSKNSYYGDWDISQ